MKINNCIPSVRAGLAGVAIACGSLPVLAQDTSGQPERIVEEVVVVAHPLSGEGLAQASDVLTGAELERKLNTNIGSTLAQQPGISSASFGKAVGRPVIHGLGGPRVRIMEDSIDTLDVSVTSTDHAVAVEPFIADRVEVLKGSSALLYGSGAIGGVVDVHTGRIPHQVPQEPISGGIETRFDSNTDGNATSAKVNGGAGNFAWHLDATFKDGDDYEIPGFAESAELRRLEELEEAAEGGEGGEEEEEEVRDILPGSGFDFENYAVGASYVADWGFFGASVSRLEANYGLPGGHHEEEGEEEEEEAIPGFEPTETPTLDLEQTRTDFELGINNPFANFKSFNLRVGINNYEHQEIEPNGEVATDFQNDAWEARSELVFETADYNGAFGVQHTNREFSALGEEAFVPPVDSIDTGVFLVVERSFDSFDIEAGVRAGWVEHDPSLEELDKETFGVYALSVGAVIPVNEALRLGINADYSSRAPVAEELYSNGPHLATNAFEIGDPDLDNERAINLSAVLNYDSDRFSASANVYYNRFNDFIFERATGEIEDELAVFEFLQDDARFIGVDLEASYKFASWDGGEASVRALFDFVDAELSTSGNDNLPRIPPLRYGGGFEARYELITLSVDYVRSTRQGDVTDAELPTEAFNDLRAYLGADIPLGGGAKLTAFVAGRNLTDDEQRAHASFIKDFAPAPGRTIEAGVRFVF